MTTSLQKSIQEGVLKVREGNMNSGRLKSIMTVLGGYELTLLEKRFVGQVKEYIQNKGVTTEQQESILEGIYREKVRYIKKTTQGEETYTGKSAS